MSAAPPGQPHNGDDNRARSMTTAGGAPGRPPIAAGAGTPPPPAATPASMRPKSVVIPGTNVNTLKMKALFEGASASQSPSSTTTTSHTSSYASLSHSFPTVHSSSSSSSSSSTSSSSPSPLLSPPASATSSVTFPPPTPTRPLSTTSAPPPTPAPAPTGAPVNRMKSFFEDKARQEQEASRGGNDARRQELAKKQEEKVLKDRVEREFFETEENYFKSLDIVVEFYVKPLGKANIISQQDMDTIFSNIETIHQIHQRLYLDLKPLFAPEAETPEDAAQPSATKLDSKTQKSLGDMLRAFIPFFKMYTVYINSFDNANKRVSDLKNSSKKFTQFLVECKDRPECKKLDLVSFLIMPIQRLPRYELLLRDILRHTSDASEHAKIEQVFNTVAEVNKHVNSEKGASILRARLYKLKAAVKHRVDIFSRPDRRLVREGDMGVRKVEVRSSSEASRLVDLNLPLVGKNLSSERRQTMANLDKDFQAATKKDFKTQYFFLFDDFLLQVVKKAKSEKYTFRAIYNLLHISVIPVQWGAPSLDRIKSPHEPSSTNLTSSSSALLLPTNGQAPALPGSGSHPLPTRSMSLKTVGRPKSTQDLTMEGMQNPPGGDENEGAGGEASGAVAAVSLESEGEVVDDPDAELMLLLVDHKTREKSHIKFKSRHEKEDWMELILKGKEEMLKLGLEGPKDLKEEAVAEKKAKEEKEKEEKELKRAQQEKEKKEKEAKMAQLQAQKQKENAMYKYDHMFKSIILPALDPKLKDRADEVCSSLVEVLADKDISELGAKMPFRLRTVRARNLIVKLQLWLQKPNDSPAGIPESALRGGLHTLMVAYDVTSAESLQTARAWIAEIKKLNPPVVGTLLAFHPAQSTEEVKVSAEAGQQAASEEGFVFFDVGKTGGGAGADEDALDSSFDTIVERILDLKEGGPTSPTSGSGLDNDKRRSDVLELDLGGKGDKKKEGKLKGILGIGKKLSRKTSNAGSGPSGSGSSPSGGGKKESRG